MYRVSRLLLIVAVIATWVAVAELAILAWPLSPLLLLGVAVRRMRKRIYFTTKLGSARWAEARDLKAAGLLNADTGLILGRLLSEE
jgi:type IV secretory pathway TraG/TraD family ATPase VirD4